MSIASLQVRQDRALRALIEAGLGTIPCRDLPQENPLVLELKEADKELRAAYNKYFLRTGHRHAGDI